VKSDNWFSGGSNVGQAVGLPDLGDLARVIVPAVVEHRRHVHRQQDLVGPHELLEQRDLRLAVEISLAEGLQLVEDVAPLGLERLPQLR
jgi:hypothetical protein